MTKNEYLLELLTLCTQPQQDFFYKMYSDGVKSAHFKIDTAINQVKNTLRDNSGKYETIKSENKILTDNLESRDKEVQWFVQNTRVLEKEIRRLRMEVDHLSGDRVNLENAEVLAKLDKLEALEQGGVDNWCWYYEALENYNKV